MSDIFNNYAKIMEEQGLLKNAQRSSEAKTRPQGIDPEAIQMLYHVKPNGKDEKPIVEQAHPEPAYVAPAYDRMNGLVENVQERQNMMIEIMEDPQHGKLTQHRYVKANNELLQELIRVATYMDNKNQEDLMKLADSCAQKVAEPNFVKSAWVVPAVRIGLALLSVSGLINNFGGMIDRGVVLNAERAVEELGELTDNLPQYSGVINELIDDIENISDLNQEISNMGVSLFDENAKEKAEAGKSKLVDYIKISREFSSKSRRFISVLENTKADVYEKWVTENLGDPGEILTGLWRGVVGTDAGDVINILETFNKSLNDSMQNLKTIFKTIKDKAEKAINSEDDDAIKSLFPEEGVKKDEAMPQADLDEMLGQLQEVNQDQEMPEAAADDESY